MTLTEINRKVEAIEARMSEIDDEMEAAGIEEVTPEWCALSDKLDRLNLKWVLAAGKRLRAGKDAHFRT